MRLPLRSLLVPVALATALCCLPNRGGLPLSWPAVALAQDAHDDHAGHDHAAEAKPAPAAAQDAHDDHDDHDDHAGLGEHDDEGDGVIRLPAATLREFGIATAVAGPGELRVELTLPGELALNPNLVAHVVPRARGIARTVAKEVGDQVATGELLAVLDSAELAEAKAGYLTVTQEVALARLDLQRAELLARNTSQALTFLQQEPPLAKLGELEGLDLGEQRRALLGAYMAMVGSRTTLERKQKLHGQQIASDAELQEAQLAHEQARAEFLATRDALGYDQQRRLLAAQRELALAEIRQRAAERHLHALGLDEAQVAAIAAQQDHDLSRLEVVAPMAGTVIERHLVPGERAGEDEAAFVIADFSVVWARLTVYPKDLGIVQPGLPVRLALTGTDATLAGIIAMVSPQVDEATRTATARVVIANPGGQWRPGAFITGEVAVSRQAAALVVPRAAVVTLEEGPAVFVQTTEGLAPRPVRLGLGDATQVEVLDGLHAGETYVVRNAFALKAELNKAAFGHAGHAH